MLLRRSQRSPANFTQAASPLAHSNLAGDCRGGVPPLIHTLIHTPHTHIHTLGSHLPPLERAPAACQLRAFAIGPAPPSRLQAPKPTPPHPLPAGAHRVCAAAAAPKSCREHPPLVQPAPWTSLPLSSLLPFRFLLCASLPYYPLKHRCAAKSKSLKHRQRRCALESPAVLAPPAPLARTQHALLGSRNTPPPASSCPAAAGSWHSSVLHSAARRGAARRTPCPTLGASAYFHCACEGSQPNTPAAGSHPSSLLTRCRAAARAAPSATTRCWRPSCLGALRCEAGVI